MVDIKYLRENYEAVRRGIETRAKGDFGLSDVLAVDKERREELLEVEALRARLNSLNKEIPIYKKEGKDTSELMATLKQLSSDIKVKTEVVSALDDKLGNILLNIPNIPSEKTPVGKDENDNLELYKDGEPRVFDFEVKAHWDIGEKLGILDFERAAKISGARFALYKGLGARLERSLINFMLDIHTKANGFTEILPPFMINRDAMIGTGQLPKFEDDMFHLPSKDSFLVPTAEVPVTNLHRDEILDGDLLPIFYTAYTPCFRKEAGSAGRDTRGLIRLHQFNKVELVKFTKPEDSWTELEHLTKSAEGILQRLGLPYRTVALSTGDIGFAAAYTNDIEVYMPSYGRYVEISSCSNYTDYQARRAKIRFRRSSKDKPEFVHTLNGSGLAVGRTVAAILENYQQEDGSVIVPEVLREYMNEEVIR